MKNSLITTGLALLILAVGLGTAQAEEGRVPVVVELFTSEGCSSCPPADRLLARLAQKQPYPGVRIIALGLHVDYWNYLGWDDRFSDPGYARRQKHYARSIGYGRIYTPQVVVDGRYQFVGSHPRRAREAIQRAAAHAKTGILIQTETRGRDELGITLTLPEGAGSGKGPFDLWLAVTEGGLATDVAAGENVGERLDHAPVARRLIKKAVFAEDGAAPFTWSTTVRLAPDWRRDRLAVAAFLQERRPEGPGAVVGAGFRELRK